MRAYRHQLAEQLLERPGALSRNRHFDTFDHADGRAALRINRHLRKLERAIAEHAAQGLPISVTHGVRDGAPAVSLALSCPRGRWTAHLSAAEFALLLRRPGVREALGD